MASIVHGPLDLGYRWRSVGHLSPRILHYMAWRQTPEWRLEAFLDSLTADHVARAALGCPPKTEAQQAQLERELTGNKVIG